MLEREGGRGRENFIRHITHNTIDKPTETSNGRLPEGNNHHCRPPMINHRDNSYCEQKAVLSQRWPRDARYISRSWAVADIWPFEIIQDGSDLFESKVSPLDPPSPKNPTYNQIWSGSDDRLRRYGHLKFSKWEVGRRSVGRQYIHTYIDLIYSSSLR